MNRQRVGPSAAVLAACTVLLAPALGRQEPNPAPPAAPATPAQPAPTGTPPARAIPPGAIPLNPRPQPGAGQAAKPRIAPVMNPPFSMFKDNKFPMIQRSVLNAVPGRIDRLAMDLMNNRLFIAAKNKGSVEVLDLANSKQQAAIAGLAEPTGVLVTPEPRKLVVSCAGDNSVQVFTLNDAGDPSAERRIEFEGETDALRYDAAAKRVYVAHGRNIGSFDIETGERGPSVGVPHMPEGFVLDPGSNRVFVNIAQHGAIVVLERGEGGALKVGETWTLKDLKGNYPMALDPANGHLFVVCRNPAKFVVLDAKNGQQVAAMDVTDDADDCWYDAILKRVYVSAGGNGGFVEVYQQGKTGDAVTYSKYHQERTNVGCRTSVWVPEQRRLIVAAPSLGNDPTFLYVYFVGP